MKLCRKVRQSVLLIGILPLLAACGSKVPDSTTLYLKKDGSLEQILVDPSPDYDQAELKTYVEDRISEYKTNDDSGKIGLESCKITDGTAVVDLSYESASDYAAFNNMVCFFGTLEDASSAGYSADTSLKAQDGTTTDWNTLLGEQPDDRVLILQENVSVVCSEEVLYLSDRASFTEEGTILVGDGDAGTSEYLPRETDSPVFLILEGK